VPDQTIPTILEQHCFGEFDLLPALKEMPGFGFVEN
jgi:hypothetical protein